MGNIEGQSRNDILREKNLIYPDPQWLEHIQSTTNYVPNSHRMFTDSSYHLSLWENAEHSILLISEDGKILSANPHFCDLVHQTMGELHNESFFKLIDKKYFKRDIINLNEIINSNVYIYDSGTQLQDTDKKLIPVRMIATRVPASLNHPFRHLVVQIYELTDTHIVKNPEYEKIKNHVFGWKELILTPWFVKLVFIFLIVLSILIALTGDLVPLVEKIIHKF